MTDRELMQTALEAMEHLHRTGDTQLFDMYAAPEIIPALRERLAQPFAMQVRPAEFVQIIKSKETLTGIPSYWAEWPNREQP